jgi:G3E family GTPase
MSNPRIPVTVLTGFLGSGKTTLLNRILSENHGQRIAVIENELGEVGVDQALVLNADEEIFEVSNGCICCRVRGDLLRILTSLLERRDRLDRVILETTGIANPGPVAQTFFIDEEIKEEYFLDGIVTVVDAHHLSLHLDSSAECRDQIAFADVLVLNKCDTVSESELSRIEVQVRAYNPVSKIHRAVRANVELQAVLGLGGFDLQRAVRARPAFLEPEYPFEWTGIFDVEPGAYLLTLSSGNDPSAALVVVQAFGADANDFRSVAEQSVRVLSDPTARLDSIALPCHVSVRHGETVTLPFVAPSAGRWAISTEHQPEELGFRVQRTDGTGLDPIAQHRWKPSHQHEDAVSALCIRTTRAVALSQFNEWFNDVLQRQGAQLYRGKGVLRIADSPRNLLFQSVHMLLETTETRRRAGVDELDSFLVLIGKGLDEAALRSGFERCLV